MRSLTLFLHIASVSGFLLAHGVSAGASFRLQKERSTETTRALVEMSTLWLYVADGFLAAILASGVALGFTGGLWGRAWIWVAIVLFLVTAGAMSVLASSYHGARSVLGIPYFQSAAKVQPAIEDAVARAQAAEDNLSRARPGLLALVGTVGLLLMLALMVFKPF